MASHPSSADRLTWPHNAVCCVGGRVFGRQPRGFLRRSPGLDIVHRDIAVMRDIDLVERFRDRLVTRRSPDRASGGRHGSCWHRRNAPRALSPAVVRRWPGRNGGLGESRRSRTTRQQQQSVEQAHGGNPPGRTIDPGSLPSEILTFGECGRAYREIFSRMTWIASSTPARSTSRWVQARTRYLPTVETWTPLQPDAVGQFIGGHAGAARVEEHQVGFRLLDDQSGDLRQAASQDARVRVILGEPVDIVLERVGAGGGANPRLTQRPAQTLLPAPCLVDERSPIRTAPRRAARPVLW